LQQGLEERQTPLERGEERRVRTCGYLSLDVGDLSLSSPSRGANAVLVGEVRHDVRGDLSVEVRERLPGGLQGVDELVVEVAALRDLRQEPLDARDLVLE